MEDAHLTETGLPGEAAATALFAVFDGHGGHEVSKFCERHFPAELSNEAAGAPDLVPGLVKTFHRMDDMIGSGQHMRELIALRDGESGEGPEAGEGPKGEAGGQDDMVMMKLNLLKDLMDKSNISEQGEQGNRPPVLQNPGGPPVCMLPEHEIQAGCTAVVACIRGKELLVGWSGDSRAIICKGGKAVALSEDHKPNDPVERSRIEKAGGFVQEMNGHHRVNGNLNLSRAIGDLKYKGNSTIEKKDQIITAEPDITRWTLSPDDEFAVLACDGVWDVMSNQEVADFVRGRIAAGGRTLQHIASQLLDNCLAVDPKLTRGIGGDNMTAIIVQFEHQA